MSLTVASGVASASPELDRIAAGNASITTSGGRTDIHQTTDRAIIDWRRFDIGSTEKVEFHQPSSGAVVLNRVQAGKPSQIDGQIKANGTVVIVNPNGVFFGKTSRVDVNSLVATSADIENDEFMGGRDDFNIPGDGDAQIINDGQITAKDAGLVGLVAPQVENRGVISARVGKVQASSGDQFTLDLYGDGLISVVATGAVQKQLVKNAGVISADGGQITLSAGAARQNLDNMIVNTGRLQARSIGIKNGQITLNGGSGSIQNTGDIYAKGDSATDGGRIEINAAFVALGGDVSADGKRGGKIDINAGTLSLADRITAKGLVGEGGRISIDSGKTWETSTSFLNTDGLTLGGSIRHIAGQQLISSGHYSAQSTNGMGGSIDVSAYSTKFLSAEINASGATGGGAIRLGGEFQGGKNLPKDELPNAAYLVMDRGTTIRSRTTGSKGKGGTSILWSDLETLALGQIDVTPGLHNGEGGFVEVSSAGTLNYDATVQTGRGARAGSVLLDPKNIVISDFSFNATAIIMGYGYSGGNNTHTNLDSSDIFGGSITLDGTRLAIGAYRDDGFGNTLTDSGAVYLYSFADTAFNGAVLEGVIGAGYTGGKNIDMSAYLAANDLFGYSVAMDGKQLAIGAIQDDGAGNISTDSGAVYLFSFADLAFNTPTLETILGRGYASNNSVLTSFDSFGASVSLNNNRLAVGAYNDDGLLNNKTDSGAVYLYSFDNDHFQNLTLQSRIGFGYNQPKDLNLTGLDTSDAFGNAVSLDGNMLVIGSPRDDGFGNALADSGSAYLVSFADSLFSSPVLQGVIGYGYTGAHDVNMSNLLAGDYFGRAVSMDAQRLVVGAPLGNGAIQAAGDSGAAYLYTISDAVFSTTTLQSIIGYNYAGGKNIDMNGRNLSNSDSFGNGVSLDGNRLIIGASNDDGYLNGVADSGAAYMFTFADASFSGGSYNGLIGAGYNEGKNVNVTNLSNHRTGIGTSVALDGRKLAIGDPNNNGFNDIHVNSGAVYLYSFTDDLFNGGVLEAIIGDGYSGGKNYSQDLRPSDYFGISLSLDGNRLVVGSHGNDGSANNSSAAGAVYLYQFTDSVFSNISLTSKIGFGYTGGKNYNLSTLNGSDQFGYSVSLDGTRLAVGAYAGDGSANILTDSGEVYLFTFTDLNFSGVQLAATIGRGYTGPKDMNLSGLDTADYLGYSINLDGNRLIVGASNDDAFSNTRTDSGAVYLFSFTDAAFSGGTLQGIIGHGYTGGKNINQTLDTVDLFGSSVALSGNTLFVGARSDDGGSSAIIDAGAVYRYSFTDSTFSGGSLLGTIGAYYNGTYDLDLRAYITSADTFGRSLAVDGQNLVVGVPGDDSYQNNGGDPGGAYFIHFSDLTYQNGSLSGILGQGYDQGFLSKNISTPQVVAGDFLGSSVSLNGNRLAVGAIFDDGFGNAVTDSGAVYLFSFTDASFNGGLLEGIIGHGYTGGKNIDMSAYLQTNDRFGYGVSLDGQMLAVGAPLDDGLANAATDSGAVYLFNFTDSTFGGGALRGIAGYNYTGGNNISVSGLGSGDYFGGSVSLDNNRLAVGAIFDDGSANSRTDSGAVYLYSFTDSSYAGGTLRNIIGYNYSIHNALLDNSDQFGRSVSLDGSRLAIGALGDDGNGNGLSASGAVYLYNFTNSAIFTGQTLEARIGHNYTGGKNLNIAAELDASDQFGTSVSLDGTRLAVGSLLGDGSNNKSADSGGAYLFTFTDLLFSGGVLEGRIGYQYTGSKDIDLGTPLLASTGDQGGAVSLDGQRLVYGAWQDDYNISNSGTVSLITFTDTMFSGGAIQGVIGNGFTRAVSIIPEIRSEGDRYGFSVALNDNRIAIGSHSDDGFNNLRFNSGSVYLYSVPTGNFSGIVLEGMIGYGYTGGKNIDMSNFLEINDQFGYSLSLNGNRLAVGAHLDDGKDNNCGDCGAVYLFNFSDAAFNGGTLQGRIGSLYNGPKDLSISGVVGGGDRFGSSVSLDATRLAVGAIGDDGNANAVSDSGAVYLFTFADTVFTTPTLQARIGYGYTGGKNINLSTLDTNDQYGTSVSVNGRRLAVGAINDDGNGNTASNTGAVYLYNFTDDVFTNGAGAGTIGYGYTGPNDYNIPTLYTNDFLGSSVSLENTVLAVGSYGDDGYNIDSIVNDGAQNAYGAVHLFTFGDLNFNTKVLDSSIGVGYTGGKNISVPFASGTQQNFGRSVSLNNGSLIVGAPENRGSNNLYIGSGAAFIFRSALGSISDALNYNSLSSATLGITASSLAALLSTPQNVTLQASNDITVSSALLVDNPSGSGGTLTLQAGRNININAAIVTDDGNLNLYANEKASTGVINAQREAGTAAITMGANGSINAGTGSVVARIDDGFGNANKTAGNINLRNVAAGSITALQRTQVGDIILNGSLTASGPGTSILLVAGANLINNAGAGALVTTDPSARWLVYSDHQNLISLGGLSPSFTANNCVYGGSCSIVIPGTGNGVLYQYGLNLLTITVNTTRAYGDPDPSNAALQALYNYSGFLPGDSVSVLDVLPTASITGISSGSVAGTVGTIVLTGGSDNVYDYYLAGGNITVVKKDITATWNAPLSKAYGDLNPSVNTTNFTYTGLALGQNNSVITATGDFGTIDGTTGVGSYGVSAIFTAPNYNVTNTPVTTLTINKRDITAAWNGVLTRSYGDSNPTITSGNFTYTGLVNGDLPSVITGSGDFGSVTAFTNVGSYSVGGVFSAANYNVTNTPSTTLNITKRDITAVVGNASRIYGDSNPTPGLGDVVFSNFANGEDETILDSVLFGMPTATALSNAGTTHAINLSVTDDNYNLIGSPTGTLTILKRDVTAIWNSALTKAYGDTNPTVDTTNFTYSNLANSDPNTSITATGDFGTIDGTTGVGSYGVGVNFASVNYNVTNTPVTSLTIGHRSLNITTNPQTKTYGDTDPVYTATVTGLTANDATLVNWLYGPVGYTGNVGTYLISASAIDPNNRLNNYTRVNTYSNYVVNKRDITASVGNRTRAYGDLLTGMTWQDVVWNNLVSPQTGSVLDTVTFLSPGELATDTVGTSRAIDIFVSDSNYNLVGFTSGTSTVIPAPLTITANHVTRFPADPAPVFTASYTGLKNNETSSVVTGLIFSTTAPDNTTLGTYTISPSGGVASQYIITYIDGVYQIQAPPSIVDIGLPNDIRRVPEIFADRQYPSVYQKRLLFAQKKRGECKYSPDFVLVRCEDDRKHASAF
ncbi:MAG: filamentous hemagglutinin N-terminal domain-containing protein [Alphaproteobacteria bacterium]|nr:filamentous hemagglutinin N-terminal domain-containing protein [Alphaproteobacteria bacterium]